MTAVAKPDLTEKAARDLTDKMKRDWDLIKVGSRRMAEDLVRAREGGAAEALGYASWEAYVQAEFGISRAHGYRLLDYLKVVGELEAAVGLPAGVSTGDISEGEARILKPGLAKTVRAVKRAATSLPADAPPEKRAEVLRETLDRRAQDPRTAPVKAVGVRDGGQQFPDAPVTPPPPPPGPAGVAVTTTPTPGQPARWRELLGDALAARVAAVSPTDPAAWCVKVVREALAEAERAAKERAKPKKRGPACPHPDNRRSPNGRCKDCGEQAGVVFRSAATK